MLGVVLSSYLPAGAQTKSTNLILMQEGLRPTRTLLAPTSDHCGAGRVFAGAPTQGTPCPF
jgi:hypothetical protein